MTLQIIGLLSMAITGGFFLFAAFMTTYLRGRWLRCRATDCATSVFLGFVGVFILGSAVFLGGRI